MPTRLINARAPIRIADCGGWTDTWFAQHGKIFNIAVAPYAEVQLSAQSSDESRITLNAENYGEQYAFERGRGWQRHPLLEATIETMGVPDALSVDINIFSRAPAGASTGTSAAVTVALIGALARLNDHTLSAHEAAILAHAVETDRLKRQSGIQDQLASAYGGINFIEMDEYPHATVTPLSLRDELWWQLERRLTLVYLGTAHDSSQIHDKVIAQLQDAGADCKVLNALRACAVQARDALLASDLVAFGRALIENTDAQAQLHPDLVSQDAQRVIEIARAHNALGWKVNGAGGDGGSLTILSSVRADEQRAMLRAMESEATSFTVIPIHLSRDGLRVWETSS